VTDAPEELLHRLERYTLRLSGIVDLDTVHVRQAHVLRPDKVEIQPHALRQKELG
jgi:hypothetical protein